MNIDANAQKVLSAILKKWKLIVLFAVIGALLAYFYTANFTTLSYTSNVEFLSYAQDTNQELADSNAVSQQTSNTSKMNYAIKMLPTYIELFQTNEFTQSIAAELNERYGTNYSGSYIKSSMSIETITDTAMFKVTVTTTDPDKSYQIANQLESSIPNKMKLTNNGLVNATVEDTALKATSSESRGYPKKCIIGFAAGAILAAAYIILRDLIDVRIKSNDDLAERYGIPVLGTIPEFDLKAASQKTKKNTKEESVK